MAPPSTEILRGRPDECRACWLPMTGGRRHRVEADIVIGADGARSTVGGAVDARVLAEGTYPGAYIYAYWQGLELDGTHWYYAPGVAAGAIPTNQGLACVFVGMRPQPLPRAAGGGARCAIPAAGLGMSSRAGPWRSAEHGAWASAIPSRDGPDSFASPGARAGRWWAMRGASRIRSPRMACTDALRDAEFLARAVLAGTAGALADYQAARDSFAMEFLELSDRIGLLRLGPGRPRGASPPVESSDGAGVRQSARISTGCSTPLWEKRPREQAGAAR